MRQILLACALALLVPAPSVHGQSQKVIPRGYAWSASPCDSFDCVMSALVVSGGDKFIIAVPTASETMPWVIVRRIQDGGIFIPPDAPVRVEAFDHVDGALTRYGLTAFNEQSPMIISAPDGQTLLIYSNVLKRTRSVR